MARGAGANIRTLLIGGCVFGAGYGSGQVIAPGDFGRILSTSNNARIIQLALKFNF